MSNRRLLPGFLLSLVSFISYVAVAQGVPAGSGPLHQLDVSAGRWVYHGHFVGSKGHPPSDWTWHEDCRWSENRVFMLCSFSNTWAGRHVDSVVIDTYDPRGSSFWHYEVFNSGDSAGKPFASKMRIDGDTRIESWTDSRHGESVQQRIVYKFASDNKVTVSFQRSKDGVHWDTTAMGTGERVGV
jgi:hypothetical protein